MFKDIICERILLYKKEKNPFVIHEFEYSYFVVGEHQLYKGYSLLYLKDHVRELHELSHEVYMGLSKELLVATKAVYKTYKPWKMNHQCIGNQQPHVHWHIIPRYKEDKYHKELPMTDVIKGEINLDEYMVTPEEAKSIATEIRKNLVI